MKEFFTFLLVVVKIYIFAKISVILYLTKTNPQEHPINELIWWSSFLVFDLWLMKQLPDSKEE